MQPFGEFAVRQDSPRPSGTPLINAGGKGIVLAFGSQLVATEYQEIATGCALAMTVVVGDSTVPCLFCDIYPRYQLGTISFISSYQPRTMAAFWMAISTSRSP